MAADIGHDGQRPHAHAARLDGVLTVALLLVHAGLVCLSMLLVFGIAMSTDACAYQECGDEKWVHYGLALVMYAAPALLLIDFGAAIALKATGRRGFYVPLLGCAGHVAVVAVALYLTSLAGPVT